MAQEYADGVIFTSIPEFEPKSTQVLRDWYTGQLGKSVILAGPPFLRGTFALERAESASRAPGFDELYGFLDNKEAKSVWLISFGTVHYPTHPNQVVVLLRTLLKTRTPFIFAQAIRHRTADPFPADLAEEILSSGRGLIVPFVPQQEVLMHPSIGAFVTHGGQGSMWEAVLAGVIPVFWPFAVDQPFHAANLTVRVSIPLVLLRHDARLNPKYCHVA